MLVRPKSFPTLSEAWGEEEFSEAMNMSALRYAIEYATDVKGAEYTVLLALAFMANKHSAEAWPRITTLARKAHLSRYYTRVCLKRLIEKGLVRERPPRRKGYPPTLRLRTTTPGMATVLPPPTTPLRVGATPLLPDGNSAGTNHARLKREIVKEMGQLNVVSLSQKKQDDVRPNALIIPKRKQA